MDCPPAVLLYLLTEMPQVYHDVYPVWTYSYLSILILVFLVTDLARYKPVIILEGFAYILTWVLLLWGNGLAAMQTMQVMTTTTTMMMMMMTMQVSYGLATSTEVAYFTYIYASVSGDVCPLILLFCPPSRDNEKYVMHCKSH